MQMLLISISPSRPPSLPPFDLDMLLTLKLSMSTLKDFRAHIFSQ